MDEFKNDLNEQNLPDNTDELLDESAFEEVSSEEPVTEPVADEEIAEALEELDRPAEEPAGKKSGKEGLTKKQRVLKEIREWVVSIAVAVLVALIIRTFLFTIIRVDGSSMETTLMPNERLFVTVFDMKFGSPERGDVVICHYPNRGNTNFVKRVMGVPGDVISRKNAVTFVNGEPIDEYRAAYYPNGAPTDYEGYTLGEDEYFVVGDNIAVSHDSRNWNDFDKSDDVGPITENMIIGRARYVIWPLSEIRGIE